MDGRERKQYEQWRSEVEHLRFENRHLRRDLDTYRPAWYRASVRIDKLQQRVEKLSAENKLLKRRVKELTLASQQTPKSGDEAPAFVKASVRRHRRKKPGRKEGHRGALRPLPDHIDVHQEVPLPKDPAGQDACPRCTASLLDLENHQRLVEDVVPAKVFVKCYHTRSGWCPFCRRRVESRAPEQPPAANIPHGQLGINALSTAMLLRIVHRLPFRQVTRRLMRGGKLFSKCCRRGPRSNAPILAETMRGFQEQRHLGKTTGKFIFLTPPPA
jgi:hypothetical protein